MDRLDTILERRKFNNRTQQEEGPITHFEVWFQQAGDQSISTKIFTTKQEAYAYAKTLAPSARHPNAHTIIEETA